MNTQDILWKTENWIFSYRIAGLLIEDGKILLQKPTNDAGFSVPGGHVGFGEKNAQTLKREFREEIGAEIEVQDLKLVGENFFDWGGKKCQQIGLYYQVALRGENSIPKTGKFMGIEQIEGRSFALEFHWIPLEELKNLEVYPTGLPALLEQMDKGVQHFVYDEYEPLAKNPAG